MSNKQEEIKKIVLKLNRSLAFVWLTVLLVATLVFGRYFTNHEAIDHIPENNVVIEEQFYEKTPFDTDFDVSKLDDSEKSITIKKGYELIAHTVLLIGPDVKDENKRYSGNHLSCTSCHLNAGTKPFAAPFVGVTKRYPKFKGRENKDVTIQERINGCMERSMNGKKLPIESSEMESMVAYMQWLGRNINDSGKIEGSGFAHVDIPERKVDLVKGETIYSMKCASCHGDHGQGLKSVDSGSYAYPPLWGMDSYNHGAGMHRAITAAQFIKGNMPFGATAESPVLTDEEAFDVAGYINSFERSEKSNSQNDFPDLKKKPVSCPYPPYEDDFSIEQHKFGPFQEIIAYYQTEYGIKKSK